MQRKNNGIHNAHCTKLMHVVILYNSQCVLHVLVLTKCTWVSLFLNVICVSAWQKGA